MFLMARNGLRQVTSSQVSCAVFYDQFGSPAVLVQEPIAGAITTLVVGDRGFAEMCQQLGLGTAPQVRSVALPTSPGGILL